MTPLPPMVAAVLGPVVAGVVWRAGMLTSAGAVAAAVIGSLAAFAGADWMVLLLVFFGSSVLLGRVGRATKQRQSAAIIEKSGPRDSRQVIANGAVFGACALLAASGAVRPTILATALGALAAAAADTWGTEIGMLSRTAPRSIVSWAPLQPGMSGGVSLLGLLATACGAVVIAAVAAVFDWPRGVVLAAAIGGFGGAIADSVLGATLQSRRRSGSTGALTERTLDLDGSPTTPAGGVAWLDNDAVNFLATLIGGGVAAAVHLLASAP